MFSFALEGAPEQHVQNVHPVMATHTEMAGTKWTVRTHKNRTEADFIKETSQSFLGILDTFPFLIAFGQTTRILPSVS